MPAHAAMCHLNSAGLLVPRMLLLVVYTSSHLPFSNLEVRVFLVGFIFSSAWAAASISACCSGEAVTPRCVGSMRSSNCGK